VFSLLKLFHFDLGLVSKLAESSLINFVLAQKGVLRFFNPVWLALGR